MKTRTSNQWELQKIKIVKYGPIFWHAHSSYGQKAEFIFTFHFLKHYINMWNWWENMLKDQEHHVNVQQPLIILKIGFIFCMQNVFCSHIWVGITHRHTDTHLHYQKHLQVKASDIQMSNGSALQTDTDSLHNDLPQRCST